MSDANARLTLRGRRILAERIAGGWPVSRAAAAAGISRQTGSKWWNRYRREGTPGVVDRHRVVHGQPRALDAAIVDELCRLRRQLWVGPHRLAWQTDPAARRCMPSCAASASAGSTGSTARGRPLRARRAGATSSTSAPRARPHWSGRRALPAWPGRPETGPSPFRPAMPYSQYRGLIGSGAEVVIVPLRADRRLGSVKPTRLSLQSLRWC